MDEHGKLNQAQKVYVMLGGSAWINLRFSQQACIPKYDQAMMKRVAKRRVAKKRGQK